MQEFKVGDKVLVRGQIVETDNSIEPYKVVCGGKELWVNEYFLMSSKTYEDGLAEAWEMCRKIFCEEENGGLSEDALKEIFGGNNDLDDVIMSYSPQDAIDKIKTWEDAREIHVGDIVEMMGGIKGLVTKIKGGCYYVVYPDGGCRRTVEGEKVKKTGRSIDIAWLLAQIGGGTEDA